MATDKKSAVDRLADQLDEAETKIEELEAKIAAREYQDDWEWRQIKKLSKEENLDLPVPRLEIRYRKYDDFNVIADYGLVHTHLLGDILFVPFGSTRIGGTRSREEGHLDLPFRDGAHIMNDMWELRLPAYVVNGKHSKQISLSDPDDLPNALRKRMDEASKKTFRRAMSHPEDR